MMGKLWLIVKEMKVLDGKNNAFYIQGGEIIKLGRVVLKVIEINSDSVINSSDAEASDSNKTDMSFQDGVEQQEQSHGFNLTRHMHQQLMRPMNLYHPDPDEPEIPDLRDDEMDIIEGRPTLIEFQASKVQEEAKRETSLDFAGPNDVNKVEGLGQGKASDNQSNHSS